MLAVVKMPRTKNVFEVRGDIPDRLLKYLRKQYGSGLSVINDDDELVDLRTTVWYQKRQNIRAPGTAVRIYRKRDNLTQADLGKMLGGLSVQKISDFENGRRGISKETAKKLSVIFKTRIDRFL